MNFSAAHLLTCLDAFDRQINRTSDGLVRRLLNGGNGGDGINVGKRRGDKGTALCPLLLCLAGMELEENHDVVCMPLASCR